MKSKNKEDTMCAGALQQCSPSYTYIERTEETAGTNLFFLGIVLLLLSMYVLLLTTTL